MPEVKDQRRANKADIMVGVLPPNQGEEMDELPCKQLEDVSRSPALVHVGNFNLPNNLLGTQHSGEDAVRRLLECMDFLLRLGAQQDNGTDHP